MKIVVLCGGISPEREVSLASGAAVAKGLEAAGYAVTVEDISSVWEIVKKWPSLDADGAFIALHGSWGEDGRLQAALDAYNIPYTGSGPQSCRLAMDKEMSRNILEANHIPVPPGFAISFDQSHDLSEAIANWQKIVVKPASGGSTVAVGITSDPDEARDALLQVWDVDEKAIVEKFIPGKELTVTVFEQDGETSALPIIEIWPHSGFYDYRSKYTAGATEYICPAPIDAEMACRIADYAVAAHNALGCRVYSRVDFRLTDENEIFALEVNTAPGMTATSLVPKAAAARGWDFPALLSQIVKSSGWPSTN